MLGDLTPQEKSGGEVRSLVRGLDVLIAVNEVPPATVSRIVERTNLPKATVIRLLATLKSAGFVKQDDATQAYQPLAKVRRLASAMMVENPFLDEARRRLNEFGQAVKWPSDLLLAELDAMVILASNRDTSPIGLKRFEQRRFPILESAGGLAYLSSASEAVQQQVITRACSHAADPNDTGRIADGAFRAIQEVRAKGYSVREYRAPMAGTRAVGVPVLAGESAVGALVLITLQDVVSEALIESQYLPVLRDCADRIGEDYLLHNGVETLQAQL